jgi:hypothetical protein
LAHSVTPKLATSGPSRCETRSHHSVVLQLDIDFLYTLQQTIFHVVDYRLKEGQREQKTTRTRVWFWMLPCRHTHTYHMITFVFVDVQPFRVVKFYLGSEIFQYRCHRRYFILSNDEAPTSLEHSTSSRKNYIGPIKHRVGSCRTPARLVDDIANLIGMSPFIIEGRAVWYAQKRRRTAEHIDSIRCVSHHGLPRWHADLNFTNYFENQIF